MTVMGENNVNFGGLILPKMAEWPPFLFHAIMPQYNMSVGLGEVCAPLRSFLLVRSHLMARPQQCT